MRDLSHLFLLRPDVVFLNHGSFGACARPVFEEYQAWQRELEQEPVEFLYRRIDDLLLPAREALAAFVGASPNDLVYVSNATTGVNIVARSLPLGGGDEVLTTDHEYGAMDRAWRFICERRGARYVRCRVPLPIGSAEEIVDRIWSAVTERTRVLFLSHITSPTAITMPVTALVRRARAAGILTLIDGAHAPGQIPLDIDALGADFYVANCHKWMMAPKGAAFVHARRAMQHLVKPLVVSWGREDTTPGPSPFVNELEWQGTRDIAPFLAVQAAIRFMAEQNWESVRAACRELVLDARQRIGALTGLDPIVPDGTEWFVQMSSIPLPDCDTVKLQKELFHRYRVEIPCIAWKDRRFVRISAQGYNSAADVDRLVRALEELLA